jgi:hypothetical protein
MTISQTAQASQYHPDAATSSAKAITKILCSSASSLIRFAINAD